MNMGDWHEHFWEHGHHWASGGPLMLLSNLFWIALIMILVGMLNYWILPRILPESYQQDVPPEQPSALESLRQRYARWEIDAMTFGEMRERLETSRGQDYQQAREMWMEEQYMRRRD